MAISASLVRELRERSGAAMMDCKKALEASSGDLEAAFDHLRKAGLKSAEKKSSRETAEGRVQARVEGGRGALVAVACETDFVAATEDFQSFLGALCDHVFENGANGAAEVEGQAWAAGGTVADALKTTIGKLGENLRIADAARLECDGRVGTYVHHNNKVGALAAVNGDISEEMMKDLCMHIAFHKPPYLRREEVPAADLEREKAVLKESDELKNKPAEFHDKIIEGKLKNFYKERCLLEQPWIRDDKQSVEKALGSATLEAFKLFVI